MKVFFDSIRASFGPLRQEQVDGFTILCNASKDLPLTHQAYLLATAWHETAATMQPIHERGKVSYFDKYEPATRIGKSLGNVIKGDGYRFRGRGYVQITGRRNYALASKKVGVDVLADPDKALVPEIASKIIVAGMTEGWFTGKKLSDYRSYEDMRRVVNGIDRAGLIAGYAAKIEKALLADAKADPAPAQDDKAPAPVPPEKPATDAPAPAQPPSIQKVMIYLIGTVIAVIAAWFGFGGK